MRRLACVCMMVLLSGCAGLLSRPPVTLYVPDAGFPAADASAQVPWRLALSRPLANGLIAAPRILVQPVRGEIEVYPQAQWAQSPPGLIADALFQALEADGRIAVLDRASSGRASDFELATELRDFQIELDGGPQALVRIKASLVAYPAGRIVASHVFDVRVPAAGQQAPEAVAAFGKALETLLPQIADWTVAQGNLAWEPAADSASH